MKKILFLSILIMSCAPYSVTVDASVGCPDNLPTQEDVKIVPTDILTLYANTLGKEGMFVNAIAPKKEVPTPAIYEVSGEVRIPEEAQNEHISINVQWVDNYTERYSEIFWTLNPYSPLYEWVWTRNALDEQILLFKVTHDNKWHTFSIISDHISHKT